MHLDATDTHTHNSSDILSIQFRDPLFAIGINRRAIALYNIFAIN